jgi:hypothetical protein
MPNSRWPEANVAGVHSQNAMINSTDRTQIPGRFDDKNRVLVHVHLDGRSSLDVSNETVGVRTGPSAGLLHDLPAWHTGCVSSDRPDRKHC